MNAKLLFGRKLKFIYRNAWCMGLSCYDHHGRLSFGSYNAFGVQGVLKPTHVAQS